ncbi:amine oxidase [Gracilaria domingensis]|nr:amine oxidase [Gracilaria domingensis]
MCSISLNFCTPFVPRPAGTVGNAKQRVVCCASASRNIERAPPVMSRRKAISLLFSLPLLPALAEEQEDDESQRIRGFQTISGLKFFDFSVGDGPTPQWGDILNIHYVLYTIKPSGDALVKHDSTYDRGNHGYLIHHGNGEHVLGLEEALHTMRAGGKRRAIVPLRIGYSKSGFAPIPLKFRRRKAFIDAINSGDGTVVFDIELRTISKDPDDRGYYTDITPTDEEIIQIFEEQRGVGVDDVDPSKHITV